MSFLLFLCPIIDYRPHYLPNKKKKEKKKKKGKWWRDGPSPCHTLVCLAIIKEGAPMTL